MKLSNKASGSRRRLKVAGLGIIGGSLVLLLVAASACDDTEPGATAEPTPVPVDATDVDVVYASHERQPPFLMPGDYDPLWGDLDSDAPIIDQLLRGIEGGTPVDIQEEGTMLSNIPLVMNVRFLDGTTWSVRQATRCQLDAEGRPRNCRDVPDHWHLLHQDETIVSRALTEWFQRVHEHMPGVEYFEILPEPITLSERFAIYGGGFHEGDRVELSIEFSDGSVLPLSDVPLEHGAFRWEGEIPETALTGPAKVTMLVFDAAEVVWSSTRSTAVAAPTTRSAATSPQTPEGAEYSMADLAKWYRRVSEVIWQVSGVAWTDLDEAKNRIDIGLRPRRGNRDALERVLATLDVPRGAIVIEVGCDGIHPWPIDPGEPPDEAFLSAVDYSLDVVSQAPYGETVQMKLTLRNVSDEPVSFVLGGRPPFDFEVSTPDGEQVWNWKCGQIIEEPLDGKTLEPGEELEFVGEWEQVDNRGEPVPHGIYEVRGVFSLESPEVLVTEAQEIEVLR